MCRSFATPPPITKGRKMMDEQDRVELLERANALALVSDTANREVLALIADLLKALKSPLYA
jgi:hypothetical protein